MASVVSLETYTYRQQQALFQLDSQDSFNKYWMEVQYVGQVRKIIILASAYSGETVEEYHEAIFLALFVSLQTSILDYFCEQHKLYFNLYNVLHFSMSNRLQQTVYSCQHYIKKRFFSVTCLC